MTDRAKTCRGDTLIEVLMSFAIFSVVILIAFNSMNAGISSAEASLELTLARNEINAQSEAIRFIHNSFLNDRELQRDDQEYLKIWTYLRGLASDANTETTTHYPAVKGLATAGCDKVFDESDTSDKNSVYGTDNKAFIINTRNINPSSNVVPEPYKNTIVRAAASSESSTFTENSASLFHASSLNPRIIYRSDDLNSTSDDALYSTTSYTTIQSVEGLWNIMIKGDTKGTNTGTFDVFTGKTKDQSPGYYDFELNACWNAPGSSVATVLSTVIRLYNPEYKEQEVSP